jgi:hypothetical protein
VVAKSYCSRQYGELLVGYDSDGLEAVVDRGFQLHEPPEQRDSGRIDRGVGERSTHLAGDLKVDDQVEARTG